jgi:cysteine desulfurase
LTAFIALDYRSVNRENSREEVTFLSAAMKGERVYLDYNASTPVDPAVLDAMLPYFSERFANPSSRNHGYGLDAAAGVDRARAKIAELLGAHPTEVIFTSGATESNNLAIQGVLAGEDSARPHLVTTAIEHSSIYKVAEAFEQTGVQVTRVKLQDGGRLDLTAFEKTLEKPVSLVTLCWANNEFGTLQDIQTIAEICARRKTLLHVDAVQALTWERLDLSRTPIDFVSLSGHKIYGPKGIGALVIRRDPKTGKRRVIEPMLLGGSQEWSLRPGTLNTPGIVGLGRALELVVERMPTDHARVRELRDLLWSNLARALPQAQMRGSAEHRIPNNLSVGFGLIPSEQILCELPLVALSAGSACTTGKAEPSHALLGLGLSPEEARATIRFGLGRHTTRDEIDRVSQMIISSVQHLRSIHES